MHDTAVTVTDDCSRTIALQEGTAEVEPVEPEEATADSCCTQGACADVAHVAFVLFSVVAFFGILVGLPVYLYLVKLPNLACEAAA